MALETIEEKKELIESRARVREFVFGQFFAIAVGAALLGYLIGLAVQYFFPDISIPA